MNDPAANQPDQAEPPATRLRSFTLKDMLLAIACVSVFMALVAVYVPDAREEARRMSCENNLKQAGLALLNYHDTYRSFPIGSRGAGYTKVNPNATQDYASSWVVYLLPFGESTGVADQWDDEGGNGFDGGPLPNPTRNNMTLVNGYVPDWLRCPSSPLPELVLIGKHGTPQGRALPTYVGVAGGVTQADWKYHDSKRVVAQTGPATGILAGNGTLLANDCIRLDDMLDGSSQTMMVAEQGDYHRLGKKTQIMVHSGATVGAWCGAKGNGIVGQSATATNPTAWNLTSIRYGVQQKRHKALPNGVFGPSNTKHLGNNNGIFSAHTGGATVVFGDGRVQFLDQDTDLEVLVFMCIRDDGFTFE